jgi:hypothetical protein
VRISTASCLHESNKHTGSCHGARAKEERIYIRQMVVSILFWSMSEAQSIHNNGRDGNDNNEVEHMCSVEVQDDKLMPEVFEEVAFGPPWIPELFNRV